jgi:hypothetical protein
VPVRPTAHHINGVEVPIQVKATDLVSESNCIVVRHCGEQEEENLRPVGDERDSA